MKAIALEDIYADPHKLDVYLASGEAVEVLRDGRAVAELTPRSASPRPLAASENPPAAPIDFRARFLEMWGPDAFLGQPPVSDLFEELRRDRGL